MNETNNLRLRWETDNKDWDEATLQGAAQDAISLSDMHLAIDIANTAISRFGLSATSQYYLALAYANCGSRDEVFKLLQSLLEFVTADDDVFTDVLSLQGRLEKDRYIRNLGTSEANDALSSALSAYSHAYSATGASFPGINAATLSLLSGLSEQAFEIANKIIESNVTDQDEFWQHATLAEAHLILEQYDQSRAHYAKVVESAGDNFGLLASVKKHLSLIDDHRPVPRDILDMLNGPAIAVFSGHMIDTADRAAPRFPMELRDQVAAEIGDYIDGEQIKIGYASAACGGDLIFCREMLKRGLELNIVLPFAAEEFRRTSVALNGVDESLEFWDILKHANSVTVATDESHLNNPCLFIHAADLIEGYALLRANQCDGHVIVVAAIDPYTPGEAGGTTERAIGWLEQNLDVHIVDIGKLRGETSSTSVLPTTLKKTDKRSLGREIMSIVEVASNEDDKIVHAVLADHISSDSTFLQGEGIGRAFQDVKSAADYAYHVRTVAQGVSWQEHKLPEGTQVQIAIHTGPIFPRSKSKTKDYFGTHVFYTRELADVTPPDCIYLTEPAAALLLTHGPEQYVSDYLGDMKVKDFTRQVYRLHRT